MAVGDDRTRAGEQGVRDRKSSRLVDKLAAERSRRRVGAAGALVFLLASAVHALSLGFLATGLWLLLTGSTWPVQVLGGICLLVALVLAPRFPRAPRGAGLMEEHEFPETAELVREVARVVGSPVPTRVQLAPFFNAAAEPTGLRGRTLTLGAPLWVACSPQAKVALLGHELGHFAHRDVLQSRFVGSAHHALTVWIDIFTPGDLNSHVVTAPIRTALRAYVRLMELANAASSRRREHYADLASVAAGGRAGAVDLLETTFAEVGLDVLCNRVGISPQRPPLRPEIAAYMASYDATARARNRERGAAERSRIDSSHPPTVERLHLVESQSDAPPYVVIDDARRAALDRELSGELDLVLEDLAASYRGT